MPFEQTDKIRIKTPSLAKTNENPKGATRKSPIQKARLNRKKDNTEKETRFFRGTRQEPGLAGINSRNWTTGSLSCPVLPHPPSPIEHRDSEHQAKPKTKCPFDPMSVSLALSCNSLALCLPACLPSLLRLISDGLVQRE